MVMTLTQGHRATAPQAPPTTTATTSAAGVNVARRRRTWPSQHASSSSYYYYGFLCAALAATTTTTSTLAKAHAFVVNTPAAASLPRASARSRGCISRTSSSGSSSSRATSSTSRTSTSRTSTSGSGSSGSMTILDPRWARSSLTLTSSTCGLNDELSAGRGGGVVVGPMLGGSFGGGLIRASVGGGFGGGERGGSGSRARTGQRGSVITTTTTIMMTGSSSSGGDVDSSSNNSSGGGDGVGVDVGVGSVGGGVWDAQEEEEWEFEEEVQALEKRLEKAVKKEDYKGAALYRDELYRIHMDETSSVLSTNSAFYAAFTAKDPDRMASLWMPSNDVMCVHPGDGPVTGHQAVSRSWRSLFSSGDGRFSTSIIKPTDVKIRVRGTTAVVQCKEEVTTGGSGGGPHDTAASWLSSMKAEIASRDAVKQASAMEEAVSAQLGGGGSGGGSAKKKKKPRHLNVTNIYRKAGGRWLMVHHHASLPPPPQSGKELRAAMGLGGLQMGEGTDGMSRIINLSDQSFNGINMDGKLDEMLESLRSQLPGEASFSLRGPSATGRAQPHSMLIIGDDEDDDDDDDDDDDSDDKSLDVGEGETRGEWRLGRGLPLTENLTKKTMQTLRTLGQEKVLGRKEQRRLITDVIQHATGDQASAVEVAYELLLAHNNEDLHDQASLAEFVDQCKILAASLFADDRRNKRRR